MNYGLSEEVLTKICQVFSHHPAIDQVVLYGSRAKGNFKTGSDIDLTLKGKVLNIDHLTVINNELDDLLLPYTLDLSIYKHIDNDNLIEHINRVGKVLYDSGVI